MESVWDYPRPPKLERFSGHIRVIFDDIIIADSNSCYRMLETSHPPTYYIPMEDVQMEYLIKVPRNSYCEFKGRAAYYTLKTTSKTSAEACWLYEKPVKAYHKIRNYLAFYASKVDQCLVNDEVVQAQDGDFYGGWITSSIKGPFKGSPGTWGW